MKINKQTNKQTKIHNHKTKSSLKKKQTEFFLCPTLMTRQKKNIFLFLTQPKTYHLSHFIYILGNFSLMSLDTANLKVTLPQDKQ